MNTSKKGASTLKLVELAILTALIIVLQTTGTVIRIGTTPVSLVLIPIVVGALLLGPGAGTFLGLVFGAVVYIAGATGADSFTFILFTDHPILTALTCFGKGAAAGFLPGLLYRLLKQWNDYAAVFIAAAAAPIANTGLFILGGLLMSGTLSANFVAEGSTVIYFLIIGCAGINFLLEFALNLIVAPAIHRIIVVVEKQLRH